MPKRKSDPPSNPHSRAYMVSAVVLLGVTLGAAAIYLLLFDRAFADDETVIFRLAFVWGCAHFGLAWLLARPFNGYFLPAEWQERLTRVLSFSLVVSVGTNAQAPTLWAAATQLVGSWVICAVVLMLSDLVFERIGAWYTARRAKSKG